MSVDKQIVALPNGLKVYTERHIFDPRFETVILVNGALATTASFGQTIRYRSLESIYSRTRRSDAGRDINGEHEVIVKAVLARDEEAAAKALERHYLTTKKLLLLGPSHKAPGPRRKAKSPIS